jgi:serine/threonine protein kinase
MGRLQKDVIESESFLDYLWNHPWLIHGNKGTEIAISRRFWMDFGTTILKIVSQIGRYQVLGELGRGAMGVVYKALDPAIGRTVAIKSIHLGAFHDPAERKRVHDRLLREAQSVGLLSHPNIVTIYDVVEERDASHIVMEYVDGSSLGKMLTEGIMPGGPDLLRYLRQVAEALDYAHLKGIVHRDIKPGNLIISTENGLEPVAKIADFGVAKFVSHEMTHSGTMMGTPSYMSPEQIQGMSVDGRSDQFSLAVVVYELLSGQKPFSSEVLPTLFYLICKREPVPIEELNPTLGRTVNKVISKALAKEPNDRFVSCADFLGALSIALTEVPAWQPAKQSFVLAGTARSVSADAAASEAMNTVFAQSLEAQTHPGGGTTAVAAEPERLNSLPPITRRRRDDESEPSFDDEARSVSLTRKLALMLAICLAIGGAIIFIVRWNSGPPVQTQIIDVGSSPTTPPENLAVDKKQVEEAKRAQIEAAKRKAADAAKAAAAQTAGTPPPPAQTGPQEVELLSDPPGAKLVIDNKPDESCQAPCTLSLGTGRHTLTADLAGYSLARRIFNVPEDNTVFVSLSKSMGVLVVTSVPSGSEIVVDGKSYGRTPATLHLAAGTHRLQLSNGVQEHEEMLDVQSDGMDARNIRWH